MVCDHKLALICAQTLFGYPHPFCAKAEILVYPIYFYPILSYTTLSIFLWLNSWFIQAVLLPCMVYYHKIAFIWAQIFANPHPFYDIIYVPKQRITISWRTGYTCVISNRSYTRYDLKLYKLYSLTHSADLKTRIKQSMSMQSMELFSLPWRVTIWPR